MKSTPARLLATGMLVLAAARFAPARAQTLAVKADEAFRGRGLVENVAGMDTARAARGGPATAMPGEARPDSGAPAVRRTAAHPDASAPGAMPAAYSTAPYSRIDNLAEMTGDSAIGAKLRAAVLDELDLIRQEAGRKAMPRRHERFERVAQRYCDTLCTMPFNQIDSLGHDCAGGRKESFGDLTQFSVELFDVSHLVVDPRDAADLIQKARKAVRRLATSDDHYRWMAEDVKGTSRFFAGAGIDFSILRGYEGTLGTEPAGRKWLLRVTLVLEMGDGNPVPAFSPGPKAHGHGKPAARTHAAPLD